MPQEALLMICPTRGRPDEANKVLNSFLTTRRAESRIWFAVDRLDPMGYRYIHGITGFYESDSPVAALNEAAIEKMGDFRYIGYVADDNRFITEGWDEKVIKALDDQHGGLVYPNDLMDPGALPGVVFMDARIVKKLGYMAPPILKTLFFDNFWLDLGRGIRRIKYMPDVVVQHLSLPQGNLERQKPDWKAKDLVKAGMPTEIARVLEIYA